ncbi:hypothetical protein M6B38_124495 [Iris pallida]|uniref:Uncharacterized protein n=1 Tax=Iris pallida TaxID=29817 RepID=A0AAX6H3B5_IRIPA|nr:hypothetical protein M6B38_124495 [Iris pallida]
MSDLDTTGHHRLRRGCPELDEAHSDDLYFVRSWQVSAVWKTLSRLEMVRATVEVVSTRDTVARALMATNRSVAWSATISIDLYGVGGGGARRQ